VPVEVRVPAGDSNVQLRSASLRVVPDRALLGGLANTLQGVARVRVIGGQVPQRERPRWGARRAEAAAN
jgi:hypothetical protein